jgi:hypothetical protein
MGPLFVVNLDGSGDGAERCDRAGTSGGRGDDDAEERDETEA